MRIWYSPYELYPIKVLNRFQQTGRIGFLLKIQTKDIAAGYADCHPIAEFGDGNSKILLEKLRAKKWTPLLKRSIHLAEVDGKAREEQKSLFLSDVPIRSHFTCSDIADIHAENIVHWKEQGFLTVKLKVGRNIDLETTVLNRLANSVRDSVRWRFDVNGGDGKKFLKLLRQDFSPQIDFLEDPMPFNAQEWQRWSAEHDVRFAFDHPIGASKRSIFKGIRVLKPAREGIMPRKVDVITNSMDHPVGQSFAYWAAQTAVKKFRGQTTDYGLQTNHLFKRNVFFDEIKPKGIFFSPSAGYGVGFNELLESVTWLTV
jgi:o-succinylbenzoate synthase